MNARLEAINCLAVDPGATPGERAAARAAAKRLKGRGQTEQERLRATRREQEKARRQAEEAAAEAEMLRRYEREAAEEAEMRRREMPLTILSSAAAAIATIWLMVEHWTNGLDGLRRVYIPFAIVMAGVFALHGSRCIRRRDWTGLLEQGLHASMFFGTVLLCASATGGSRDLGKRTVLVWPIVSQTRSTRGEFGQRGRGAKLRFAV